MKFFQPIQMFKSLRQNPEKHENLQTAMERCNSTHPEERNGGREQSRETQTRSAPSSQLTATNKPMLNFKLSEQRFSLPQWIIIL